MMEFLDEDFEIEELTEPKPRKQKRTKDHVKTDDKYVLSFTTFLENRKKKTQIEDGDDDDPIIDERHQETNEDAAFDVVHRAANGGNDEQPSAAVMVEESLAEDSPKPAMTTVKPRHAPVTSTPRKEAADNLNVTENRANYTKLYRIHKDLNDVQQRLIRVEEWTAGHSSDGISKLVWPVQNRAQLDKIELALHEGNQQMVKDLERRFKRADRKSLYEFIHSNLDGLLSKCGRWTWTGKTSNVKSTNETIISETLIGDEATETYDDCSSSCSSPANLLKSVTRLHEVCFQTFEGITQENLVKETMHSLTNINNANKKRIKRASAAAKSQAGSSKNS